MAAVCGQPTVKSLELPSSARRTTFTRLRSEHARPESVHHSANNAGKSLTCLKASNARISTAGFLASPPFSTRGGPPEPHCCFRSGSEMSEKSGAPTSPHADPGKEEPQKTLQKRGRSSCDRFAGAGRRPMTGAGADGLSSARVARWPAEQLHQRPEPAIRAITGPKQLRDRL